MRKSWVGYGLTIWTKDAWYNVSPSNTEPIIRFNTKGHNQKALYELVAEVTQIITT